MDCLKIGKIERNINEIWQKMSERNRMEKAEKMKLNTVSTKQLMVLRHSS